MRRLISAMLLAGALALTACGGDDGGDAKKVAPRLSAAQYRAQLTQLCQASEREAEAIGGVQGANAAALADYFDKIAAVQTRSRAQFERLRPPSELQDEHAQIAPLLAQEVALIKQTATSFRAGSDPRSTFETYKTSENRVLRKQAKLLAKMKVAQCQPGVDASGNAAPGSS